MSFYEDYQKRKKREDEKEALYKAMLPKIKPGKELILRNQIDDVYGDPRTYAGPTKQKNTSTKRERGAVARYKGREQKRTTEPKKEPREVKKAGRNSQAYKDHILSRTQSRQEQIQASRTKGADLSERQNYRTTEEYKAGIRENRQKQAKKAKENIQNTKRQFKHYSKPITDPINEWVYKPFRTGALETAINREYSYEEQRDRDKIAKLQSLADKHRYERGKGWFKQGVQGTAELFGQMTDNTVQPNTVSYATAGGIAAATLGQLGPQVLAPEEIITVPGAMGAGAKTAYLENLFRAEKGASYREQIEKGVDPKQASLISTGVGTVNTGLEFVQLDELGKMFKFAKQSADVPALRRIATELGKRGVSIGKEVLQEVAQEGVSIAGSNLGQHMSDKPLDTKEEVLGRLKDTAVSSALTFGIMNAPSTAIGVRQQAKMQSAPATGERTGGPSYVDVRPIAYDPVIERTRAMLEERHKERQAMIDAQRAEYEAVKARMNESRTPMGSRSSYVTWEDYTTEDGQTKKRRVNDPNAPYVGSKNVRSYAYENPILVAPLRRALNNLREDQNVAVKGQRFTIGNDEMGHTWTGVKRSVSDIMAVMRDEWNMSYKDIKDGTDRLTDLYDAIGSMKYDPVQMEQFHDQIMNSNAKRVELALNTMLTKGHYDYEQGKVVTDDSYTELMELADKNELDEDWFGFREKLPENLQKLPPIPERKAYTQTEINEADYTDAERSIDKFAKVMGAKRGVVPKVRFFETDQPGVNGYYEGNTIFINRNSDRSPHSIFAHELTHHAENSQFYKEFKFYVFNHGLAYHYGTNKVIELVREKQSQYAKAGIQLDMLGAEREIMAEYVEQYLLKDQATIEDLARRNQSLFYKVYAYIRDSLKWIGSSSNETQFLIQALQKYDKALQTTRDVDRERMYFINKWYKDDFRAWDKSNTGVRFKIGTTSEPLKSIGIEDRKIYMDGSKILKVLAKHKGMEVSDFEKIPEILENPVLILESQTIPNRVVLMSDHFDSEGDPIIAVLELKPTTPYGREVNAFKVANAYGKKKKLLNRFVENSRVLYVDPNKKRTEAYLKLLRLQLPAKISFGSNGTVTYFEKEVNPEMKNVRATYSFGEKTGPSYMEEQIKKAMEKKKSEQKFSITPEENFQQAMNGFDEMEIGTEFKTRKTPSTVAEAKTTPSDFAERINKEIQEGKFQYSVIKDRNTRQKVDSRLENEYIEDLFTEFERDVEEGRLSKETMVLGERLIQGFIKLGESDKAERAVILLAEAGTRAGQSVQAISMMKKLSPVGKLMAVKRAVQKMNEEFVPPGEEEVGLTEEEVEDIVDSDTPERADEAGERVIEAVYERLPVTAMDRLNAWRYLAMLGNPRTHVRNILGNFTFYLPRGLKNVYAMGLEKAFKIDDPTKAIITHKDKALVEFAKTDFAQRVKDIKGEARWTDVRHIQDRQIFGGNPFFNTLEALRNFNFNLLEAEDEFFLKRVYAKSFASYLKANKISEQLLSDPNTLNQLYENGTIDMARDYATKEAKKATYRDDSKMATFLNKAFKANKSQRAGIEAGKTVGRLTIEAVMPFKKTPINVLKRGFEYSPAGLLKSMTLGLKDVKDGKIAPAEFIDDISSGLSGTTIAGLGLFLASKGLLRGRGSEDEKEEAFLRQTGTQKYSVVIGDNSYTIDWMAPTSLPLFVGVEIFDNLKKDSEERDFDVVEALGNAIDTLGSISDPMFEMSMLQSLTKTLKSYKESGSQLAMDFLTSALAQYGGQYVPTLGGQVQRTIDPVLRDTRSTKTGTERMIDSTGKQMANKIPYVASKVLEPRIDVWGDEVKGDDNFINRLLQNTVSPGYYKNTKKDPKEEEIFRLYQKFGERSILPPRDNLKKLTFDGVEHELTSSEKTAYLKTSGQYRKKVMDDLLSSKAYQQAPDADKKGMIGSVYKFAHELTKDEMATSLGKVYEAEGWVQKAKSNPSDYIIYRGTVSSLPDDKDGKLDKLKALDGLQISDQAKLSILEEDFDSKNKSYSGLVKAGISISTYIDYEEFYSNVKVPVNAKGNEIRRGPHSRKEQMKRYIQSLDLTAEQKWMLYHLKYKK